MDNQNHTTEAEMDLFDLVKDDTGLYIPMMPDPKSDANDVYVHVEVLPDCKIIKAFLERDYIEKYTVSKGPGARYSVIPYGTMVKKLNTVYKHSAIPVRLVLMSYSTDGKLVELSLLWNSFYS